MKIVVICAAALLLLSSMGWCDVAASTEPSADAVRLARDFETAIRTGDSDAAGKIVDGEALVARGEKGIAASAAYAARFRADAGSVIGKSATMSVLTIVKNGGSYKLIHVRHLPDKTVAVYRMLETKGAVDYYEWEIGTSTGGELRFVDQYDMIKGDWISHLLRKYYLAGVASEDKDNSRPLEGRQKEVVDSLPMMDKLSTDIGAVKFKEAIADYNALPPSMREDKTCLVLRITAADQLSAHGGDGGEYDAAIADFEKYYPNDPAVELLALDRWMLAGNFSRAHLAVDRIRDFVGEDAHLECVSGNLGIKEGTVESLAKALGDFKRGIELEPELKENYWGLLTCYVAQKDYVQTAAELTDMESKLSVQFGDLTKYPMYSGFVQSDAYKTWMAGRAAGK